MAKIIPGLTFAFALLHATTGCVTDPQSCSLDARSSDPGIAACAEADNATCVVESHPECRGEICIQWRGEPGFCSIGCQHDDQCGSDERCVEVVLATGEGHCVPASYLD